MKMFLYGLTTVALAFMILTCSILIKQSRIKKHPEYFILKFEEESE